MNKYYINYIKILQFGYLDLMQMVEMVLLHQRFPKAKQQQQLTVA